jgi:hypothetical protein
MNVPTRIQWLLDAHRRDQAWAMALSAALCAVALAALMVLAGCADVATRPGDAVQIPTGTPCLTRKEVPAKPDLVTDAQLKAMRADTFVASLYHDRLKRIDYEAKLEATIEGCVGEKPIPASLAPTTAPAPTKPRWQFWN